MCIFTSVDHNKRTKFILASILINIAAIAESIMKKIAFVKSWISHYWFILNKCFVYTNKFKEESRNKSRKKKNNKTNTEEI